ncbi:MAG: PKD repeat protein [Saprospiraceae bacterium]|jgi:PKD repeat protein
MYQSLAKVFSIILLFAFTFNQGLSQSRSSTSLNEMFFSYDIKAIDSKSIHSEAKKGDFFIVEIPKQGNGSWFVELHDSKIVSDDYISQLGTSGGTINNGKTNAIPSKGHVVGDLSTTVSLTFNEGFIYGYIKDKSGYNYIEPLSYYDKDQRGNDQYVVYNAKDLKPTAPHKCGTTEMHDKRDQLYGNDKERSNSRLDECFDVEIAIANDFAMFEEFGSAFAVEDHAIGVMNNVQANYDDEFADELQYVIVTQFTVTNSGGDPWSSSADTDILLPSFRSWGNGGGFGGFVYDVASLWTDKNIFNDNGSGVIGVAYVGVICTNSRYNLLENFTNNPETKRVMVAHELGHNFGSFHDSGSGDIMAPFVSTSTTWSSQSINAINNHVDTRTCLDDCSGSGAAPTADFIFTVIEDCTVGEVIFINSSSGANLDYEWSFPGGIPSSSTLENPSVQYPDGGTYGATLTVTNSSGSDVLVQNDIFTINPSPIVNYSYAIDGVFVSFFNFTQFGNTYFWDFGDGQFSIESDPVHNYIDDGVYTVTLTVASICGDESKQEIVVVANPPTADFIADVEEGCEPLTVQFTSNSSNNTDDYVWTFEGGSPSTSGEENPTVTYEVAGDWDVTLTVLNETGDDVLQITEYISVLGQPVSDFSYTVNASDVDFTNFSVFGDTYIWTFGDGSSSTEEEPTHTYDEDGTYTVVLTVENECGSNSSSTEVIISLEPIPSFSISNEDEGCAPMTVNYQNTSTNSPDTFEWEFEGGSPATSTDENPEVIYTTAGIYDVILTVTNENGSNSETFVDYITINDVPTTDFIANENGLVVTFTDQSSGAVSYAWSFGDGNTSTAINPTHTYSEEGVYTVTLETTNECGTTAESISINNYTPVSASFTSDITNGCADLEVGFIDQSSSNVTSWSWTFDGGTPATSVLQNPIVTYSTAGQYKVKLTVSHPESSETVTLTNYISVSDDPITSFEFFNDLFDVEFSNTTIEGATYSWNFGDGTTSSMINPSHTYGEEGAYNVVLTATNTCGTTTASQMVEINSLPTAAFNATNSTGCGPLTVDFNNNSSSNAETFAWTFEGGTPATSMDENPTVTYASAGSYPVMLVVTSPAGMDESTIENFVVVIAEPTASIDATTAGNEVTATNSGTGSDGNTWSVGGETFETDILVYTFPANGTYTIDLVAFNECGMITTSTDVVIDVYPVASFGNALPIDACVGESITLMDNSTNAESKVWTLPNGNPESSSELNPIVIYDAEGSYDVTLTVLNTYGSSTETIVGAINVTDVPTVAFEGTQNESTISFVSTSTGVITYSWDFGDGTTSEEENPIHTYGSNGTYEVILTVTNQCGEVETSNSYIINVNAVTEADFGNMKVYPNPASDYLTISIENTLRDDIKLSIIDVQGKIIASEVINTSNHTINTTNLLNGTYMLRLSSNDASFLKKIVILK